jgi:excinuclease ABC subunit B
VEGKVIMYADKITRSMEAALKTTNERRAVQQAYNEEHGIEPKSIMKSIRALSDDFAEERELAVAEGKGKYTTTADLPKAELAQMVKELEKQMKQAAQQLEFEKAALLRDQVVELRQIMALKDAGADSDMPAWERMRKLDEAGIAYEPGD